MITDQTSMTNLLQQLGLALIQPLRIVMLILSSLTEFVTTQPSTIPSVMNLHSIKEPGCSNQKLEKQGNPVQLRNLHFIRLQKTLKNYSKP